MTHSERSLDQITCEIVDAAYRLQYESGASTDGDQYEKDVTLAMRLEKAGKRPLFALG